jgi:hypothetical protein
MRHGDFLESDQLATGFLDEGLTRSYAGSHDDEDQGHRVPSSEHGQAGG